MPGWLIALIVSLLVIPAIIGIIILIVDHNKKKPHPDEWWLEELTKRNVLTLRPNGKGRYIIHFEIYLESWNKVGLDGKTVPTCRVYKTYTNTPTMCLWYLFRDTRNWFGFPNNKDDCHDSKAFKQSLIKFLNENVNVDPIYRQVLECFRNESEQISKQFNKAYNLISKK